MLVSIKCLYVSLVRSRLSLTCSPSYRLSTGTAIEISGVWKACPAGKEQSHELQTTDVNVVGATDPQVGRYTE